MKFIRESKETVHPVEHQWTDENSDGDQFHCSNYRCSNCGESIGDEFECEETCPHCGIGIDWSYVERRCY